jgi:hypothetical protein
MEARLSRRDLAAEFGPEKLELIERRIEGGGTRGSLFRLQTFDPL